MSAEREEQASQQSSIIVQRDTRTAFSRFWDWGIPTAVSLAETTQTVKIPVIASGGVRSGTDVAKALALNASLASVSQPVLQAAVKGAKDTENTLSLLTEELRNVMFLVGAEKVENLAKTPIVVMGKTAAWLKTRGFNVENYAIRGARWAGVLQG